MKLALLSVMTVAATTVAASACTQLECHSQNECPSGEACSADGTCVAQGLHPTLVQQEDASAGINTGGTTPGDGEAPQPNPPAPSEPGDDTPYDAAISIAHGHIGPMNVEGLAMRFATDGWLEGTVDGAASDGLLIVMQNTLTLSDMLHTPGTYAGDVSSIDSPVFGQACTINESDGASHYDEPVATTIVVDAPEPNGDIPVSITQRSAATDVTVATLFHKAP